MRIMPYHSRRISDHQNADFGFDPLGLRNLPRSACRSVHWYNKSGGKVWRFIAHWSWEANAVVWRPCQLMECKCEWIWFLKTDLVWYNFPQAVTMWHSETINQFWELSFKPPDEQDWKRCTWSCSWVSTGFDAIIHILPFQLLLLLPIAFSFKCWHRAAIVFPSIHHAALFNPHPFPGISLLPDTDIEIFPLSLLIHNFYFFVSSAIFIFPEPQ